MIDLSEMAPGDEYVEYATAHCPKCMALLEYFSGIEQWPAFLYCPQCMDTMYDVTNGKVIGKLE